MLLSLVSEKVLSLCSLLYYSAPNLSPQTACVKFKEVSVAFADGEQLTRIKDDPHSYLIKGARTSTGKALAMDIIFSIKFTFRPFQTALGALSTSPSVMLVAKQITVTAHDPVSSAPRESHSPLLASPTKKRKIKDDADLEPPKLAEGQGPSAGAPAATKPKPLPKAPEF